MKNLKSNMSKLLLITGLATALTGCGSNTNLEVTPTPKTEGNTTEVTPTPEATPEVVKGEVTEGYAQVERDGECYWDENGEFIHNHPLDLDNFIIDFNMANNVNDESVICTSLHMRPEITEHYISNNGEAYNKRGYGSLDYEMPAKVKKYCPTKYETAEKLFE